MSTLASALSDGQWELAAHLLVLATLLTVNGQSKAPGAKKGGSPRDGQKGQRSNRQGNRSQA
ncbi:MAG: hypothetical protein SVP26_08825 [Chloroflexota bacterium]|nr:hypothetical protein [Chloroflexota bacterium]